jgi:hypothetical protein
MSAELHTGQPCRNTVQRKKLAAVGGWRRTRSPFVVMYGWSRLLFGAPLRSGNQRGLAARSLTPAVLSPMRKLFVSSRDDMLPVRSYMNFVLLQTIGSIVFFNLLQCKM